MVRWGALLLWEVLPERWGRRFRLPSPLPCICAAGNFNSPAIVAYFVSVVMPPAPAGFRSALIFLVSRFFWTQLSAVSVSFL